MNSLQFLQFFQILQIKALKSRIWPGQAWPGSALTAMRLEPGARAGPGRQELQAWAGGGDLQMFHL